MDLIAALRCFIRVVETGSFSAVSRESQLSQSAVTRQIAQLEQHFAPACSIGRRAASA